MKILHFIRTGPIKTYPLGTPGRFTDLIETLRDDGHENTVLLPELPVLQAALERKEIPFTLTNVSFIDNIFRMNFYKKILKNAKPDIIVRYNNEPSEDFDILEELFNGPIRNIMDFYVPVLNPDPSIKKLDREETMTDPTDTIIGCFAPDEKSIEHLEILFQSITKEDGFTLWFAIDPEISQQIQKMAAQYEYEDKSRFFDITVPRGAFYKGCDLIFVPQGGSDSDMSFVEAAALGRPIISCHPAHETYGKKDKLKVLKHPMIEDLHKEIHLLSDSEALQTQIGETGRKIYEEHLTPYHGIKELISHI